MSLSSFYNTACHLHADVRMTTISHVIDGRLRYDTERQALKESLQSQLGRTKAKQRTVVDIIREFHLQYAP